MSEKVSIIIPVFNREKYIGKLIESIQRQLYKNIEIILVDDGSTDLSTEIIRKYSEDDQRIKLFLQANMGAPTARNNGFNYCTGDFIIFFDSDDYFESNSISLMVEAMIKNNSDILIGNVAYRDKNYEILDTTSFNLSTISSFDDFFFFNPLPGNKMIRKEFLREKKLYFKDVGIGQDLLFYIFILLNNPKIHILDNIVMNYIKHSDSISGQSSLRILDILKTFNYIENYMKDLNSFEKYSDIFYYLKSLHITYQLMKVPYFCDTMLSKHIKKVLIPELKRIKDEDSAYLLNNKWFRLKKFVFSYYVTFYLYTFMKRVKNLSLQK